MIVMVLSACPTGLRGDLTKWLLEISPGVFVGQGSARIRDLLWDRVVTLARDGRAIMVYSSDGEQRLRFKVHRHTWLPVDHDGLLLMRRPADPDEGVGGKQGWSMASRFRASQRRRGR
ncbi:MAG: type I-E CRISPR-associated endoribonuclease Cas2e [Actinomycetota bacterium]